MARQLFEGAVTVALIGGKGGPIGRKADVALAGRALAVAQVAGEFLYGVVLLAPQVAFELKHRAPEKRVDAAPHLGHRLLEVSISGLATPSPSTNMRWTSTRTFSWPGRVASSATVGARSGKGASLG